MIWVIYSILIAVFATILTLIFTYIKISSELTMFYVSLFTLMFFVIHAVVKGNDFNIGVKNILILFFASICSYLINYFFIKASRLAPNPAYASGIFQLKLVFIAVVSIFMFNASVSVISMFGLVLIVIGAIFIGV